MDTSIFINAKNYWEEGSKNSRHLLELIKVGQIKGVISTITVAELLNGAYRLGIKEAQRLKTALEALELTDSLISGLSFNVADKIGELCAKYNARIRPDVIIVATALLAEADSLITRDIEHFERFKEEIEIAQPEEILSKT